MDSKKFQPGSFLSSSAAADFKSQYEGLWTGLANANSNTCIGTSAVNPQWHTGGLVPPSYKPNSTINIPTRYVEINCLYCNTRFSTPVFATLSERCWSGHCMSCQKWFKLHMEICNPECENRFECLMMGILTNAGRKPIMDITGIKESDVGEWIVNPHATVNIAYDMPTQLYVIKYENLFYETFSVQDDGFKGDPFQLPDVSRR